MHACHHAVYVLTCVHAVCRLAVVASILAQLRPLADELDADAWKYT